jgi:hypothetical protein
LAVSFNGTRVNPSDANTNWGNWNSGGGAPSAEAQLAYQGGLAVNKKVTNTSTTTRVGLDYDPGSGAVDMTAAANRLWFVKVIVADSFDLQTTYALELGIGSASTAYYSYCLSGTAANLSVYNNYPVQGGYLITAIDPNIAAWREGTTGSPSLTAVDYFAGGCALNTGAAKAENFAIDAIDIGTGLTLITSETAGFVDFVTTDQGNSSNRWGVVTGAGDVVRAHGLLSIGVSGGATATTFSDNTSIVNFSDGYHSRGLVGIHCYIQNASDNITIGALLIGEGTRNGVDANDTRPDFTVTGTSGTLTLSGCTMNNFRDVTLTSAVDATGANIECHLLTQSTATIGASGTTTIIRTNALANTACVQSLATGTPDITYTDFVQTGAGHAISITAAGSYTFDNLSFTGYGANDSSSSAILVSLNSASDVNITLNGTVQPTVNDTGFTGGGVVNFITAVTLTIEIQDTSTNGTNLNGARVEVYRTDTGASILSTTASSGGSGTPASASTASAPANTDIVVRVRQSNSGDTVRYKPVETVGNTGNGTTLTITMQEETIT